MGRAATVTYAQVAAAAEQLKAEGLTPTAKLTRSLLGDTGSLATLQRYIVEWRSKQGSVQPTVRLLAPEIQRVVFKFIDEEIARSNSELTLLVEQARRDAADLAADNEDQAELVRQLQAELAEQATLRAQRDGQFARLLEELSSAREDAAVERREAERARLELGKLQLRLETHASLENELRQLRAEFEVQRQACVHAEQNVAVLKVQRETLEARVAELKQVAPTITATCGDGRNNGEASMASEPSPRTSSRRAKNSKETDKASTQVSAYASGAAASPSEESGDPRQAKLC